MVLVVDQIDGDKGGQYVSQIDDYCFLYLFSGVGIICQFKNFWCVVYDDVYFGELLYYLQQDVEEYCVVEVVVVFKQ